MNLWKKFKKGIQKSTEKAADIVEGGIDIIKAPPVDALELGKFQTEVEKLRQNVTQWSSDLGNHVFDLYTANRQDVIVDEIESEVEHLQTLKEELAKKEKDLEKVFKAYESQSVSMNKLKAFKDELEASDSAIEYFKVEEGTPYIDLTLSEIELPDELLLGLIIRNGKAIIPAGVTEIKSGDKIMLMGKKEAVLETLYKFSPKAEELT